MSFCRLLLDFGLGCGNVGNVEWGGDIAIIILLKVRTGSCTSVNTNRRESS